jgi:hypothetical protein
MKGAKKTTLTLNRTLSKLLLNTHKSTMRDGSVLIASAVSCCKRSVSTCTVLLMLLLLLMLVMMFMLDASLIANLQML